MARKTKTPRTFSATAHANDGRQLARVDGFASREEAAAAIFDLRPKATHCTTFWGEGSDIREHDKADILALVEQDEPETEEAEEAEADEQEADEADAGRSIVKAKYRQRYQPAADTCGDDIAQELRDYLATEDDEGKPCIDRGKLEKFARKNDLWNDAYAALNNGQVRMNVGNRLRAKVRKQPDWQPAWPK